MIETLLMSYLTLLFHIKSLKSETYSSFIAHLKFILATFQYSMVICGWWLPYGQLSSRKGRLVPDPEEDFLPWGHFCCGKSF